MKDGLQMIDKNTTSQDIDIKFHQVNKATKKTDFQFMPSNGIVRFQFLEVIFRIILQKYLENTRVAESEADAVK